MELRAAQTEHGKSYLGVIGRDVDTIAWRVDICPVVVLIKGLLFVSFIRELNVQRQGRNPPPLRLINITTTSHLI